LPEKDKALLRFVDKVNRRSPEITAGDMQPLYAAGWADDAIYYAITVCALFNFYNRWIDASGVPPLSDEAHRQGGKRSAAMGYVRK
jgi:alkylhydroperoxidase family enzyme